MPLVLTCFFLFSMDVKIEYKLNQGCTQNLLLGQGSADPEAIYNLCLILKMYKNHVINITAT